MDGQYGSPHGQPTSATCQLWELEQVLNFSLPPFPLLKKRNGSSADLRGMLGRLNELLFKVLGTECGT